MANMVTPIYVRSTLVSNRAVNLNMCTFIAAYHYDNCITFYTLDHSRTVEWKYDTQKERDLAYEEIMKLVGHDI
jgi:hypothetical protein